MKPKKNHKVTKSRIRWALIISIWTFLITFMLSIFSESLINTINLISAIVLLIIIILIGIIFDIIGTAVTAADETSFHSMCSKKIPGAKYAVNMVKNADRVSNFCNDVVGDICGIVSGAAGTSIVYMIISNNPGMHKTLLSIFFASFAASLTVGGKAFGKNFAMRNSDKIIYVVAYIIYIIRRTLKRQK